MIRGEPAIGHEQSRANHACIRLNPYRVPTMKQSYASAGKAPRRRVHSPSGIAAIAVYGLPPPRIVIGYRASNAVSCRTLFVPSRSTVLLTPLAATRYRPVPHRGATIIVVLRAPLAPQSACDTTAPARCLSGTLGSATPTGSAHVVPARCRPWPGPSLGFSNRSRRAIP